MTAVELPPIEGGAARVVWRVSDQTTLLAAKALLDPLTLPGRVLCVGDGDPVSGIDLFIVDPTPAAGRFALLALLERRVHGLVLQGELTDLVPAVGAWAAGGAFVPKHLIELAAMHPALPPRSCEVLAEIACDRSNAEMARRLNMSISTVKREVALLADTFVVGGRRELQAAARDLGYPGSRARAAGRAARSNIWSERGWR